MTAPAVDQLTAVESADVYKAGQVLGRWPADKYNLTAEQVTSALADQCAARPVALRALYQQLCVGWLTGNGDIHAKNLAIRATPDGEWRVAPAYDLPSTALQSSGCAASSARESMPSL